MNTPNEMIIDVREPEEFSRERIPGSINAPLSSWQKCAPLLATHFGDSPVTFVCKSGMRASMAADQWARLYSKPLTSIKLIEGGLQGWKKRGGIPEGAGISSSWNLFRQVQAIVGPVVLLSSLAAIFINPRWAIPSAAFGLGLSIAGFTGYCGLAMLLSHMPWNKSKETSSSSCATDGK